jgi:hypothetical protein
VNEGWNLCPKCNYRPRLVWHGWFFVLCARLPRPHMHCYCQNCGYNWVRGE